LKLFVWKFFPRIGEGGKNCWTEEYEKQKREINPLLLEFVKDASLLKMEFKNRMQSLSKGMKDKKHLPIGLSKPMERCFFYRLFSKI